jgi:hypothetical protein
MRKVLEYLDGKSCVDCGFDNILALEFDHVRGEKRFNVGTAVSSSTRSWKTIKLEIDKCDIRCANCHRIRTLNENGCYKANTQLA